MLNRVDISKMFCYVGRSWNNISIERVDVFWRWSAYIYATLLADLWVCYCLGNSLLWAFPILIKFKTILLFTCKPKTCLNSTGDTQNTKVISRKYNSYNQRQVSIIWWRDGINVSNFLVPTQFSASLHFLLFLMW